MHYHNSDDASYNRHLRNAAPTAYKGLMEFDKAVFEETDSGLDRRTKELIAVAVAATTQCPYCIDAHVKNAHKEGATEAEVAAAVMISAALRAGGSFTHGWMAMKVLDNA
ncbi:carboxymuconolactone decarboxylase family protein [Streptomyces sp. DT2A-34]|uniref:carboxymuconolactone decarboxylase family protein n=1 Tax=Streptomyces sp. DT2A-34 TaxID=3051182 RepID=UPI00265C654C|nr:carboxymuconolactone decarboxylase family protein [Streptomyces sp. DT2A-34]MDO0916726.1 carboxymuconolactone decarboxylase family protein [Streptomyces sp. DT2A-34]